MDNRALIAGIRKDIPGFLLKNAEWKANLMAFVKDHPSVHVRGPESNKVALTFDDGPCDFSIPILDILREKGCKASFSYIGDHCKQFPDIVKRTDAEGHVIINHGYTHRKFDGMNGEEVIYELRQAEDLLFGMIGARTALARPPHGGMNAESVNGCVQAGYETILWSVDALDWLFEDKQRVIDNVLAAKGGDVILMHTTDYNPVTLEALPFIIDSLKERFELGTIDEVLGLPAYKGVRS